MISIKKLATIGAAAGLLAMSAVPAFADDDLKIKQNNWAPMAGEAREESEEGQTIHVTPQGC